MELSSSNIKKNSLYFIKRKHILCSRKRNPALFSPSPQNKRTLTQENLLYFRKQNPPKNPYISVKRNSKKASYISGGNMHCPKNN